MFIFNPDANRYEALLATGTHISVSAQRFADDVYNRASVAGITAPDKSWEERQAEAWTSLLTHPTIYRAKHNGLSVIVTSTRGRKR